MHYMKQLPQSLDRGHRPSSVIVGLTLLIIAIVVGECLRRTIGNTAVAVTVRRSLMVLGWLALWRPIEQITRRRAAPTGRRR
jgi:hypothetical protein